jgi:cytochrome c oxidase subunit 1
MATAAVPSVVHPRAAAELGPDGSQDRLVVWLYLGSGVALIALMGILGLVMRLTQGEVLDLSPSWFYRAMTLHGAGMLTGALLAMMGGLWLALRPGVALDVRRALGALAGILLGAVAVLIAVLVGGFATGWTFLYPLPFHAVGQWSLWATVLFLVGMLLVGVGFVVYCVDVLQKVTAAHGGLAGSLGLPVLRGREGPPPQAIAATVVAIAGLLASAVGTTVLMALLVRAIDADTAIDPLWAKNTTYFFGHTVANLIIYLGAGLVYVLIPRFAGRPWRTSAPIVVGWLATLVLVLTAYSHHLYMDLVQPGALQYMAAISSFGAALPVAVVTIFTAMMLVWGSAYRWTLASALLYLGFVGWAIGGTGAVIDSIVPVNFRLHNTLWVPGHFHTYLMLGIVFWALALVVHLLERAAGRPAGRRRARVATAALLVGGYGLVATWYLSGALGVPRRYAVHPVGTDGYALAGAVLALVFAAGFLVLLAEAAALGRDALAARRALLAAGDGRAAGPEAVLGGGPGLAPEPVLATRGQLAGAIALAVAAIAVFLPAVTEVAELDARRHHFQHAGEFLFGLLIGLVIASLPGVLSRVGRSRWIGDVGLLAAVLAPAGMLLMMPPAVYEALEGHAARHALYHVGIAATGLVAGLGCGALGRLTGRLMAVAALGMAVVYAVGVSVV